MDGDQYMMVRGGDPTGTNFAIGEPYFLHDIFWRNLHRPDLAYSSSIPTYPPPEGLPELQALLTQHFGSQHYVVTAGAKQALYAAIYALKKKLGVQAVYCPEPYWPSFKSISEESGLKFGAEPWTPSLLRIHACPNNPAEMNGVPVETDIWDAVYATPVYDPNRCRPSRYLISVHSVSKMYGMSGLRVGWAATKDEELARYMAEYVEKHSSGVSTVSQIATVKLMEQFPPYTAPEWDIAHLRLSHHGDIFRMYLNKFTEELRGAPADGIGMFAWFKPKNDQIFSLALKKTGISLLPGAVCGEPGWYRMSLGHRTQVLEDACRMLCRELEFLTEWV